MDDQISSEAQLSKKAEEEMDSLKGDNSGKVTIKTGVLLKAVQKIAAIVNSSNSRPILQGIYFHITPDQIHLRGANDVFFLQTSIDKDDIIIEGELKGLVIPAKKFSEIVSKLSGVNTTLKFDGKQIIITSKGAKLTLSGESLAMFPDLPVITSTTAFDIPSGALLEMYRQTVYSVAKDDKTPILCGVLHHIADKRFSCISTDKRRLSRRFYDQEVDIENVDCVIPEASISQLVKLLKSAVSVKFTIDKNIAVYETENEILYTRFLNGEFPNTERIIPKMFTTKVNMIAEEALAVVQRASIYTDDHGTTKLTMLVNPSERQIRFMSSNSQVGSMKEDIFAQKAEGDFISITLNPRYLHDILSRLNPTETIQFAFNADTPFGLIVPSLAEGNISVIVPVKDHNNSITEITDFTGVVQEIDLFSERAAEYAEQASEESTDTPNQDGKADREFVSDASLT